jgi:hypothetical protein
MREFSIALQALELHILEPPSLPARNRRRAKQLAFDPLHIDQLDLFSGLHIVPKRPPMSEVPSGFDADLLGRERESGARTK